MIFLVLAACSGEPPGIRDDCDRLCARSEACSFLPELSRAACVAACAAEVEPYGPPGEAVLASCTACLEAHSCAELAGGACATECPHDGLRPRGPPSGDAGPPSDDRCATRWGQDGLSYEVRCERSSSWDSFSCWCFEDGIRSASFDSLDFCDSPLAGMAHQAATGCDWPLESPCTQGWYQIGSLPELGAPSTLYEVRCRPDVGVSEIGYTCSCLQDGTAGPTFTSDAFCQATHGERLDLATAECAWELGEAGCVLDWVAGARTSTFRCEPLERSSSTERDGDTQVYVACECLLDGVPTSGRYTIAGTVCTAASDVQTTVVEALCRWTLP